MRISKLVFAVMVASLGTAAAHAADMAVKAPPAPPPPPSPWDVAIIGAVMSDYNFRGITQSNHQPSVQVGFEPRYNFSKNLQGYFGVSGESIDFPNRAAAEIDFYAGIRPTFDKLVLDFGVWYYYYPRRPVLQHGGALLLAWRRSERRAQPAQRQRRQRKRQLSRILRQSDLHAKRQRRFWRPDLGIPGIS